jgi:hypothetical protein
MSRYLSSHRQDATRMKNIQSKFRIAPICVKMFQLQCYKVATVIHTQSLHSQLCVDVYVHMFTTWSRKRNNLGQK